MKHLSFIGTGKMASAIAKGICLNGVLTSDQIIGTAPDESRNDFQKLTDIPVSENNSDAMNSRMVVLAFKPQMAEQICRSLQPMVKDQYFVSICAGITLENLQEWLGSDKVTRTMPNTPLCVSKGAVAYCSADGVNNEDLDLHFDPVFLGGFHVFIQCVRPIYVARGLILPPLCTTWMVCVPFI